jgi:tetratricopeptide (TPR) repeat protein
VELLPRGSALAFRAQDTLTQASAALGHLEVLERLAVRFAAVSPDGSVRGAVLASGSLLAFRLRQAGRRELGRTLFLHMKRLALQVPAGDPGQAFFKAVRAWEAQFAGELDAYMRGLQEAAPAFETAGDHRNACMMRVAAGHASTELGRPEEGIAILRAALQEATLLDLGLAVATARHNLGYALWRVGQLDEAEAVEREAVQAFAQVSSRRLEGLSRVYLADILQDRGQLEQASDEAARAIALLENAPLYRPRALATRASIAVAAGRISEALELAWEARGALPADTDGVEGEALVRLVLVEALSRSGREPSARQLAAEARERLMIRAARIGDPEWRESFLRGIAEHRRTLELAGA